MDFFNSKECEWSDMRVAIAGKNLVKIRGLKYKVNQEKDLLHAAGNEPIGTQSGNKTYSGSLKILKGALDDLNRAAKVATGSLSGNVTDIQFDLIIEYRAKGSRIVQNDLLKGVSISEYEKGWEQGAKYMEIEMPFLFERIAEK